MDLCDLPSHHVEEVRRSSQISTEASVFAAFLEAPCAPFHPVEEREGNTDGQTQCEASHTAVKECMRKLFEENQAATA